MAAEAPIGVLMLDTSFERPLGDVGNPATFPFPIRYRTVPGATAGRVVAHAASVRALLPAFVEAGEALAEEGCSAVATSCGFLACVQRELAAALPVPVATSALQLLPLVRSMTAGRPVGVLTADARHLGAEHLSGVGVTLCEGLHIRSMADCAVFRETILAPKEAARALDTRALGDAVVSRCVALRAEVWGLGAFLFECTNLEPYAHRVRAATGLPVFGIVHLVRMLHGAAGGQVAREGAA